jgi:hypothetical protein
MNTRSGLQIRLRSHICNRRGEPGTFRKSLNVPGSSREKRQLPLPSFSPAWVRWVKANPAFHQKGKNPKVVCWCNASADSFHHEDENRESGSRREVKEINARRRFTNSASRMAKDVSGRERQGMSEVAARVPWPVGTLVVNSWKANHLVAGQVHPAAGTLALWHLSPAPGATVPSAWWNQADFFLCIVRSASRRTLKCWKVCQLGVVPKLPRGVAGRLARACVRKRKAIHVVNALLGPLPPFDLCCRLGIPRTGA